MPNAKIRTRYSAYAYDVTAFMKSNAEIDEVVKDISRYKEVIGVKINRDNFCGLALGCVEGSIFSTPFILTDGPLKILDIWFGPDYQLDKNWFALREKVKVAV